MPDVALPRPETAPIDERLGLPSRPARLFSKLADGRVQCHLCPRHCTLAGEKYGFCKVRKNSGGELVTLNYGVSVQLTEEVIETEAVNHFYPGARILSLGNVGCMMRCTFCQNWATSQAAYVREEDVRRYTPEEVVETALAHGIGILSWTYNDPVVWHEFVVDTARLAKKHGILNLYKSAFYIGPEAVEELHEVIDIFSLSLKSMDPVFYAKMTRARLEPVLDAIKQVHRFGDRHLELSNLLVTGANDSVAEAEKVARWMLDELGPEVPLHYVRFHPAFEYTAVERTGIGVLKAARERALEMGMKHVYLGNVFETGPWSDTACAGCGAVLVKRFGLRSTALGLDGVGKCRACGLKSTVTVAPAAPVAKSRDAFPHEVTRLWSDEIGSGHVEVHNTTDRPQSIVLRRDLGEAEGEVIPLRPGEQWRFLATRERAESRGVAIGHPDGVRVRVWTVLDRAHFPTAQEMRP